MSKNIFSFVEVFPLQSETKCRGSFILFSPVNRLYSASRIRDHRCCRCYILQVVDIALLSNLHKKMYILGK